MACAESTSITHRRAWWGASLRLHYVIFLYKMTAASLTLGSGREGISLSLSSWEQGLWSLHSGWFHTAIHNSCSCEKGSIISPFHIFCTFSICSTIIVMSIKAFSVLSAIERAMQKQCRGISISERNELKSRNKELQQDYIKDGCLPCRSKSAQLTWNATTIH